MRADGQVNCGNVHMESLHFSLFDMLHLAYKLVTLLRKYSPHITRHSGLNLTHTFREMFPSVYRNQQNLGPI
jgi:hypothetical protein